MNETAVAEPSSDVTKVFEEGSQRVEVLQGVSLDGVSAGEVVALEGPVGLGQDDPALHHGLHPHAHLGRDRGRRASAWTGDGRRGLRDVAPALDRLRVPAVQPLPAAHRARERGVRR